MATTGDACGVLASVNLTLRGAQTEDFSGRQLLGVALLMGHGHSGFSWEQFIVICQWHTTPWVADQAGAGYITLRNRAAVSVYSLVIQADQIEP
jgi:hypothetical protein